MPHRTIDRAIESAMPADCGVMQALVNPKRLVFSLRRPAAAESLPKQHAAERAPRSGRTTPPARTERLHVACSGCRSSRVSH